MPNVKYFVLLWMASYTVFCVLQLEKQRCYLQGQMLFSDERSKNLQCISDKKLMFYPKILNKLFLPNYV